jgi:hypothetical protein
MQNEDENQLRFRDFSSSTCAESRERGGLAAKKGADPQMRWLQAKNAALACSHDQLKLSGAGRCAGTSVRAEAKQR